LIRRMEEGPMLDLEQIPWADLEEHVNRLTVHQATRKS
jgi:hypothetical protein